MNILLICNYKPGVGGISGQVDLLQKHLREDGYYADIFSTKGSFIWRLSLPYRLRKALKNYDLLHIHCCSGWGFLPALIGIPIGRRLKKRVVLTYHGGGAEQFFDKHTRLIQYYLRRTDINIVLSGFLANVFEKNKLPYTIIPNIIELDNQYYRERTALQPNFICTRAHEPIYNISCILRAFKNVQQKLPEATLEIVGDGSQHEQLIQQTKEIGLKNVTFTGRVDNNEIYNYLDSADILLTSPVIDNMPVSILEAMNAGLLVISSKVGGIPYMIEDGETGLLFENNNDKQLAEKMLWAFSHSEEVHTITKNAFISLKTYSWESIKVQIISSYQI